MSYLLRTYLIFSMIVFVSACGASNNETTIKNLDPHSIKFERAKPSVLSRDQVIENYKTYVKSTTFKENYSSALKRLADLELESSEKNNSLSDEQKNREAQQSMQSSITHYNTYLQTYPGQKKNDLILYQLAKAHSYNGDYDIALNKMNIIVEQYPNTIHIDEVQFRRGEILFTNNDYKNSEVAYAHIVNQSPDSILYEKSLYKLGWSQFKQSKYLKSLDNFFHLLDLKQKQGKLITDGLANDLSRSDEDFIMDVLRVVSLGISYTQGTRTINRIFANHPDRNYEALIYKNLAELYLKKDRHIDAANVYLAYGKKHPVKSISAQYHILAIQAFASGNFHDLVLSTKISLIKHYGTDTVFWTKQTPANKANVKKHLILHITELANHFHAVARTSKKSADYKRAAFWYSTYLTSFPDDNNAYLMNFLLAESLFDAREYKHALTEYTMTAYGYKRHDKAAESAYASILTYNKLVDQARPATKEDIKSKAINNAMRYCNSFPTHKHATEVITKTAEELYLIKKYTLAVDFARRIIDRKNLKKASLLTTAWTVYAHSLFELNDYAGAELAYIEVLKHTNKNKKLYADFSDRLAASIYKQGEAQRNTGHFELAAFHFLRLGKVLPTSSIRATAEYDAATMHLKLKNWNKASKILEDFQTRYPKHIKYSQGITEKLILSYTQAKRFGLAARQIMILSVASLSLKDKQSLAWQAAEMYTKAGKNKQANKLYMQYIAKYPRPFSQNIEAHRLVSDYYLSVKKYKKWGTWLQKTVKFEATGGNNRSDRSKLIAAQAVMHIAKPIIKRFKLTKLNIPLKKSLKKKKALMKKALKTYADVIKYNLSEITTESTYRVAEIYHHFAKSLMQSQRPKGLNEEELEQYDILLEEQAYPFEEKTIDIHSSNSKRMQHGIYDKWIKLSLKVLAGLQPVRYSKQEKVESYADIISK